MELSYDNFLVSKVRELPELSRVVEVVSTYSVEAFSVHLPYDWHGFSESRLSSVISRLSSWMRVLSGLSVGFYVTHLPSLPPSTNSINVAVKYLSNLTKLVSGDSQILVENTSSTALLGARPEDLLETVNQVSSPVVGVCVDTGHAQITKTPLRAFSDLLGNLVRSMHVHDNDGLSDKHMLPGSGVMRIEELAEFAARVRPFLVVAEVVCKNSGQCEGVLGLIRRFGQDLKNLTLLRAY